MDNYVNVKTGKEYTPDEIDTLKSKLGSQWNKHANNFVTKSQYQTHDNLSKAINAGKPNESGDMSLKGNPDAMKTQQIVDIPHETDKPAVTAMKAYTSAKPEDTSVEDTSVEDTTQADMKMVINKADNPNTITPEDSADAKDQLEQMGVTTEKGTIDKEQLMKLLAKPMGQSHMITFLNALSAIASVATLGIIPRIDFGELSGQKDYISSINNMIQEYNSSVIKNYTEPVANAEGNADANEITSKDANAAKAGQNRLAQSVEGATLDKAFKQNRELAEIKHSYEVQMKQIDYLNQMGLMDEANKLQANLEATTKKNLMGLYDSWSQTERDNYAKGMKATNGKTFADQGMDYITNAVGVVK